MTTVSYRGIDYNVVFIDPSISINDGDGSSPSQAMQNFPSLTNNTCYLVRRTSEDDSALISQQIDSSIVNFMILGMPKASDPQWIQSLVTDETVNSAWKGDSASYANVRFWHRDDGTASGNKNYACLGFSGLKNATFINAYLFKGMSVDADANYDQVCGSPMLINWSSSLWATIEVYQCKIGTKGINLDSDSYLADADFNSGNGSSTVENYNSFAGNYFNLQNIGKFIIKDSIINNRLSNYAGTSQSSYSYRTDSGEAIRITGCNYFEMENCQINYAFNSYATNAVSGYASSIFVNFYNTGVTNKAGVYLRNNTFNCIASYYGTPMGFRVTDYNTSVYTNSASVNFINNKINIKKFGQADYSTVDPRCYDVGLAVYGYTGNYIVDGLSLDAKTGSAKLSQACCLSVVTSLYNPGKQAIAKVSNIDFKLDDTGQGLYPVKTDSNYVVMELGHKQGNSKGSLVLDSFSQAISNVDNRYMLNTQGGAQFSNINIDAPYCYLQVQGATIKLGDIRCGLYVYQGCSVDVDKLTYDKLDRYAIDFQSSSTREGQANYVRVRDLVIGESATTPKLEHYYNGSQVYIDKSNYDLSDSNVGTFGQNVGFYSTYTLLNMGATGRLFARNNNTFCQSWATSRTGGSTVTLKFNCNTDNKFPLWLGDYPYKGFSVVPSSTGSKLINIFLALRDFTGTLEELAAGTQCFAEIVVPYYYDEENTIIGYKTYRSTALDWYEDDSTWSDSGVVPYRISVPIDVSLTTEPIEVKLCYNLYHATGYTYIDPQATITENTSGIPA